MSAIGHVAVGLAAARIGRPPVRSTVGWAVLLVVAATMPDLDLLLEEVGLAEHRGASHSLGFGLLIGLLAAGLASLFRLPALRIGALVGAVVASHAVLDMFSLGPGVKLLWPISETRISAPWQPLPTPRLGALLSSSGAIVLALEVLLFLPLLAVGLWPRPGDGGRSRTPRSRA